MANFGFGRPREATMPGLNAKLSDVGALLSLARLEEFETVLNHRAGLAMSYQEQLPSFIFQRTFGRRLAHQFMPVLLPENCPKRWLGKFGQVDKWKICLRAVRMPRIRSDNGKAGTSDA